MYKVMMHMYDDKWNVMDTSGSYVVATEVLNAYRKAMPNRVFRLEKHSVEILDV